MENGKHESQRKKEKRVKCKFIARIKVILNAIYNVVYVYMLQNCTVKCIRDSEPQRAILSEVII